MINISFSEWIAVVGLLLAVVGFVWNVATAHAGIRLSIRNLEDGFKKLTNIVEAMKVNVDKIPLIEFRLTSLEHWMDRVEARLHAVEVKVASMEVKLDTLWHHVIDDLKT